MHHVKIVKIIRLSDFSEQTEINENIICAIGNFDGVHKGHQKLLKKATDLAKNRICSSAVFTFSSNTSNASRIYTDDKKFACIAQMGITYAIVCPFEEVRTLSCEEYVQQILIEKLHTIATVVGFNFHFGYKGIGTNETLYELMTQNGFTSFTMEPETYKGTAISSTRIRSAIQAGEMEDVYAMMGRYYSIDTPVVAGKHLGHTLGFATANQSLPEGVVVPPFGVYATTCVVDGVLYTAVSNVGTRPTVENSTYANCETSIFDFSSTIYGESIQTNLIRFMHPEQRFSDINTLQATVLRDCQNARDFFKAQKEN